MTHKIDLCIDLQYGSTGKGLITGYLAKRGDYDTAICAYGTNAGHRYVDGDLEVMVQQLPMAGVVSKTVKTILIGPGAVIHASTLQSETRRYADLLQGKKILIHPHACVVEDYHANYEINDKRTKIGSTAKGVGEALIERIRRYPDSPNIVCMRWNEDEYPELVSLICTQDEYREALEAAESVMIE